MWGFPLTTTYLPSAPKPLLFIDWLDILLLHRWCTKLMNLYFTTNIVGHKGRKLFAEIHQLTKMWYPKLSHLNKLLDFILIIKESIVSIHCRAIFMWTNSNKHIQKKGKRFTNSWFKIINKTFVHVEQMKFNAISLDENATLVVVGISI